MTYYESAEGVVITKERARHGVEVVHDGDWSDFLDEVGDQAVYDAQKVLDWLNY